MVYQTVITEEMVKGFKNWKFSKNTTKVEKLFKLSMRDSQERRNLVEVLFMISQEYDKYYEELNNAKIFNFMT
jgi:hypothetical protein